MSADKRTLVIAAAAMVVLVAVGVVSAAVFTRSACDVLDPETVPAGAAGGDVEAVLAEALDDLDPQEHQRVLEGLESLARGGGLPTGIGPEGLLVGAADVGRAEALTGLGDGVAATGDGITAMPGPQGPALAAELSDQATVVGAGGQLHALVFANELTGQVDGIVPIDTELQGGECFDTSQVGIPLTFHLDADGGELLALRVDDDAERPEVELRDAEGSVWSQRIELGAGPPGVLAERLSGHLDDELVVTARRALADDPAPALSARERSDGVVRWELGAVELDRLAPAGDEPLEVEVVEVTEDLVVVALSREEQSPVLVVAVSAADGEPVWTSDLDTDEVPRAAGIIDDEVVVLAPREVLDDEDDDGRNFELARLDPSDGAARTLHATRARHASATVVGPRVVFAVDDEIVRVDPDGQPLAVGTAVPVLDVRTVGGYLVLLLRSEEGGAVVWVRL